MSIKKNDEAVRQSAATLGENDDARRHHRS